MKASPHRGHRVSLTALSFFLLNPACSGVDGSLATSGEASVSGADAEATSPARLVPARLATNILASSAEIERVSHQIPGRNLQEDPPLIESVEVIPAGADESTLRVRFAEKLPQRLEILVEGSLQQLHDDGRDGDQVAGDGTFVTTIPANLEEALRGDRFSDELSDLFQPALAQDTLANTIPYAPWSLVVTDLAVVNDPGRVSDPCKSRVSPSSATLEWSFGYLMTHMANQAVTNKTPAEFAKAWLSAWKTPFTLNGDPVSPPLLEPGNFGSDSPENVSVAAYVEKMWTQASRQLPNNRLDPNPNPALKLEKAPFRLLAIVNRYDKRKNSFFGEGSAGELRFVFGVLDSAPDRSPWGSPCGALFGPMNWPDAAFKNSTVIFEYAVDKATQSLIKDWARAWRDLTLAGPPSNSAYRTALQTLTDSVVKAGVGKVKGRANDSALIRIRTNESVDAVNWRLREFRISSSSKFLVPDTVKQTPAHGFSLDDSKVLAQYVNTNATSIEAELNKVPNSYLSGPFLGAQAFNRSGGTFWNSFWINAPQARHKFSLNTCNGCHSTETGTAFAHIMSREWGEEAPLSGFMTGIDVSDPVTGEVRHMSQFDDRVNDMSSDLYGTTFQAIGSRPSSSAD